MTVRVRKHVTSDTVHLPEIKPLIGKDVEITITERPPEAAEQQDLRAFFDLAGRIDLDFEAIEELRRISIV